jgi:hypothetical protein
MSCQESKTPSFGFEMHFFKCEAGDCEKSIEDILEWIEEMADALINL